MVQLNPRAPTDLGFASVIPLENTRSIRTLQEAVVKAAIDLAAEPGKHAHLLLLNPQITPTRLAQEREVFDKILRPDIRKRLHIIESRHNKLLNLPSDISPELQAAFASFSTVAASPTAEHLGTPDFNYTISQILFHQYLKNAGPMTGRWLAQTAGCSYPTVAQVLAQFSNHIKRHSNRTFELKAFYPDDWRRLIVNESAGRHTIRFVDASGSPRSPENLFKRLQKLANPAIAVGGTFAIAHSFREFNLVGNPRLDLTIHSPESSFDLDFVNDLDPALKRADPSTIGAPLVIHFIRRTESFFSTTAGVQWADPVECLLDLHDMRLEEQADQFYNHLIELRKKLHD